MHLHRLLLSHIAPALTVVLRLGSGTGTAGWLAGEIRSSTACCKACTCRRTRGRGAPAAARLAAFRTHRPMSSVCLGFHSYTKLRDPHLVSHERGVLCMSVAALDALFVLLLMAGGSHGPLIQGRAFCRRSGHCSGPVVSCLPNPADIRFHHYLPCPD